VLFKEKTSEISEGSVIFVIYREIKPFREPTLTSSVYVYSDEHVLITVLNIRPLPIERLCLSP
jgi:hypothetical protein